MPVDRTRASSSNDSDDYEQDSLIRQIREFQYNSDSDDGDRDRQQDDDESGNGQEDADEAIRHENEKGKKVVPLHVDDSDSHSLRGARQTRCTYDEVPKRANSENQLSEMKT
ncbi:uncharacterized protein IL334_007974 [Kwoniella shivajii]|uniref:Histone chaperone domain-containing protein n=1 Tax=Kwoniella shivajii TaxID=564305 RepID=A0ABZ1DA45_9TREE|nr:hypothetical protein IL334_007974 [Kwoniella shivajii]